MFYHKNKEDKEARRLSQKGNSAATATGFMTIKLSGNHSLSLKFRLAIESPLTPTGHISNRN